MSVFWLCVNSKNYPSCNFGALKEWVKKTVKFSWQITKEFKKAWGWNKLILANWDKRKVYGTGEIRFYSKKERELEYVMIDKFKKPISFSELLKNTYFNKYNHNIKTADTKNVSIIKTWIFPVDRDLFNIMGKLCCAKKSQLSLPLYRYWKPEKIIEKIKEDNIEIDIDTIKKIIDNWETDKVEFKSSIRWDYKQNKHNTEMEFNIKKAICAFLNSEWGILFIGIKDNWDILWLDNDYKTLGKKKDKDGILLHIDNIITKLGGMFNKIKSRIQNIDGKDICIVEIKKNESAVFLEDVFYVRGSASSLPLYGNKMVDYIKTHFL